MKLTKSLTFNRKQLRINGFTDLGKHTPKKDRQKRGDHALVFLFQPFRGKWVQTLSCFLSTGCATGDVLHKLIKDCITLCENSGLRISAVVTDGATWNRNMWKNFGISKNKIHIQHIIDPDRKLWFISDFPHLIKCVRNFLAHPKRDRKSGIWVSA